MRTAEPNVLGNAGGSSVSSTSRRVTITFAVPKIFAFALLVPIAIYVLFAVFRIDTPGLQYDESLFINAALGNLDGSFIAYRLPILGHDVILMCIPYIGALKSWIWSPIFGLFGVSPMTVRLPAVALGAAAIALTFLYVRRLFDRNVAAVTVALLALDPSYIFGTRLDWGPIAMMSLLKAAVLYTGYLAWTRSSRRLSVLAGFFLGLGIFDKTNFGWLALALVAALAICYPQQSLRKGRVCGPAFALGLGIGVLPLLIYNVAVPFGTFAGQFESHGSILEAFGQRIAMLHLVLDGEAVVELVSSGQIGTALPPYVAPETILWSAFECALLFVAVYAIAARKVEKRLIFVLCLFAFIFIQIVLTPNATGPHHTLFIYPLPHIIVAYVGVRIAYYLRDRVTFAKSYAYGVLGFLFVALAGSEAIADSAYVGNFVTTGGAGAWSDKIYTLERILPKDSGDRVALLDWGFDTQLNGLSHDRIVHDEAYPALANPEARDADEQISRIIKADRIYVFHAPLFATFPLVRERFDDYLKRHHLQATVREMRQEDGVPVYDVVTLGSNALRASPDFTAPAILAPSGVSVRGVSFAAEPIVMSSGQAVGVTTLHWSTPYKSVSIFVGKKDGTLFTNQDGVGSAQTGTWATDGMKFYLEREIRPGDPSSFVTIATVTAHAGVDP